MHAPSVETAEALSAPTPVIPGSFRHAVITSSKRFKSTWVELGKLLVQVRDEGSSEGWGYPSFETYCFKELHLRKATVLKLTRSFSFLSKREPEMVRDQEVATERAPAFEVVEVLAAAEERGQLSDNDYASIRETIWNPEKPPHELRRELGERFPSPEPEAPPDAVQLRRLAAFAKKLAAELKGTRKVPRDIAERAATLAEDVEELAARMKADA